DAADTEAVRLAIAKTIGTFGGIDILVNNAGIGIMAPIEQFSLEDFEKLIAINVRGLFVATQEAARHLREGGRIIHIGSRSEEHTSELQSRLVISYAVFCLKKKNSEGLDDWDSAPAPAKLAKRLFDVVAQRELKPEVASLANNTTHCSFLFNETATTEIYTTRHTLSLHDALPIPAAARNRRASSATAPSSSTPSPRPRCRDRKSTRLNSSHALLSRMPSSA